MIDDESLKLMAAALVLSSLLQLYSILVQSYNY